MQRAMQTSSDRANSGAERSGAAAAEFALILPFLILIILGAIDLGQFVHVGQVVSNASREGARQASRDVTLHAADVEAAVRSYLDDAFPHVSASTLAPAVQVNVLDGSGQTIPGGNLATIPSGDPLSVEVVLQFDTVRWIQGVDYLNGQGISATTTMRRE